eukprot:CAMPEP_0168522448 /NCGR_PEP_ID=MMETSP0405-20121227/9355_1 /TAXON_ID=498012 /ORGANISM="Trichosphaerium sp, Strain Am-I-7 wt" /LENGTH=160 /DNA_ID=CAMNT_0008544055 /DNA_START=86 /DNA_END=568 /DNA_ORIENTATION=+
MASQQIQPGYLYKPQDMSMDIYGSESFLVEQQYTIQNPLVALYIKLIDWLAYLAKQAQASNKELQDHALVPENYGNYTHIKKYWSTEEIQLLRDAVIAIRYVERHPGQSQQVKNSLNFYYDYFVKDLRDIMVDQSRDDMDKLASVLTKCTVYFKRTSRCV